MSPSHVCGVKVNFFFLREWFQPVKSDLQSISLELSVERRLRSSAEDRLRRTEEELRQLQRENRTYQVQAIVFILFSI